MRHSPWSLAARVFAVIAVLALVGIVLRLIGSILVPLLPPTMMQALSSGWNQLYSLVGPAIGPIGALAILALLVWIILGRR
jgi:hypothetical protein